MTDNEIIFEALQDFIAQHQRWAQDDEESGDLETATRMRREAARAQALADHYRPRQG